jgi:predicted TIM-barrel fold metal-dependent hydrolase
LFIADSQVHIWKEETPDRPWIPGARERMRLNGHREKAFTYQECLSLMDENGVNRVVIVPPSWEGDRTDYALEACEAHPDRFCVMARVPQNEPEEGKALMREFASIDAIKGIRLTFHRPIDGTCDWIWPYAEELGIKVMVHAPIWKTELGTIAEKHPNLTIIIDHMGILARSVDDAIGYWVQETADLHTHPNISVKVSALPGYSTHPYP